MKTLAALSALAVGLIWIRRRRARHPLEGWVRAFYDEAVIG